MFSPLGSVALDNIGVRIDQGYSRKVTASDNDWTIIRVTDELCVVISKKKFILGHVPLCVDQIIYVNLLDDRTRDLIFSWLR
jgi:hypothetical protein